MEGFGQPSQQEQLKLVSAILRRVYSPEPCQVPEQLKERMRRLKEITEHDAERGEPKSKATSAPRRRQE